MRRVCLILALASLLALGGQSFAELCTIDAVPAATLLLPYFEVSLEPIEGVDEVQAERDVNTFFSVNNASAAPTVAHVVLWGDWSLPSIDFDIFLTGYDVETVNLGDLFNNGNLPITAHATNDPDDLISPHGREENDPANASGPFPGNSENPQWDSAPDGAGNPLFPGCDTNLPLGTNPVLTGSFIDRVRCGHTGRGLSCEQESCIGQIHEGPGGGNDFIARGYITIDNVTDCNLLFPNQAGYFGSGLTSEVNQLWGDYFIVQDGRAVGDNMVSIEADPEGMAFSPGDYTFYGRYVDGLATDQREPLGSTWATRYFTPGAAFSGGTSLLVWRDSKCQTTVSGFGNGCVPDIGTPPWWPLDETQVVSFDVQEDAFQICDDLVTPGSTGVSPPIPGTVDPIVCFPLETGRYRVGEGDFNLPYDFGWMYLNTNFLLGDTSGSPTPCSTDGLFGDIAQSWVVTELDSDAGEFSVGFAATQLTSACSSANPLILGDLGAPDDE
ncbi:MAG: hypothetical protein AAF560_26370 [Acidobacteriota bacterium]